MTKQHHENYGLQFLRIQSDNRISCSNVVTRTLLQRNADCCTAAVLYKTAPFVHVLLGVTL